MARQRPDVLILVEDPLVAVAVGIGALALVFTAGWLAPLFGWPDAGSGLAIVAALVLAFIFTVLLLKAAKRRDRRWQATMESLGFVRSADESAWRASAHHPTFERVSDGRKVFAQLRPPDQQWVLLGMREEAGAVRATAVPRHEATAEGLRRAVDDLLAGRRGGAGEPTIDERLQGASPPWQRTAIGALQLVALAGATAVFAGRDHPALLVVGVLLMGPSVVTLVALQRAAQRRLERNP